MCVCACVRAFFLYFFADVAPAVYEKRSTPLPSFQAPRGQNNIGIRNYSVENSAPDWARCSPTSTPTVGSSSEQANAPPPLLEAFSQPSDMCLTGKLLLHYHFLTSSSSSSSSPPPPSLSVCSDQSYIVTKYQSNRDQSNFRHTVDMLGHSVGKGTVATKQRLMISTGFVA